MTEQTEQAPTSNARAQAASIMAEAFETAEIEAVEPGPAADLEAEETETTAAESPETDELSETAQAEGDETQAAEGDEPQVRNIKELAEALEVDPSFLYDLEMPVAGGEPIKLGQVKDMFQEAAKGAERAKQLDAEQAKLQQAQREWVSQQEQVRTQILNTPVEAIKAQATMMSVQAAWEALEKSQGSYSSGDLALRRQELQTAYQTAQQRHGAALSQYQQQQKQKRDEILQKEAGLILEAVPEWREPKVAAEGRQRIANLMAEYGFERNSLDGVMDSRIIRVLHEFAQLKEKVGAAQKEVKKGTRVPRMLKPGAVRSAQQKSKQKLETAMSAAKTTTNLRKKASAISQLLRGT